MALENLEPKLPRFTGSDPISWISQSELYFLFYSIHDDERFSYVIEVFEDEPFYWFNSWFRSDELTWNDFTTAMLHQFQVGALDNPNSSETGNVVATSQLSVIEQPNFDPMTPSNVDCFGCHVIGLVDDYHSIETDPIIAPMIPTGPIGVLTSAPVLPLDSYSTDCSQTNNIRTSKRHAQVIPMTIRIVPSTAPKPSQLGSSATLFNGLDANSETKRQWIDFVFDPGPMVVHRPYFHGFNQSRIGALDDYQTASLTVPPLISASLRIDAPSLGSVNNAQNLFDEMPNNSTTLNEVLKTELLQLAPLMLDPRVPFVIELHDVNLGCGMVAPTHVAVLESMSFLDLGPVFIASTLDEKSPGVKFDYVSHSVLSLKPAFHFFGRVPEPPSLVSLASPLDVVPTDFAQTMLNCASFVPKLFVLDKDPKPPDPCRTLISDSVTVLPKPTHIVLAFSITHCSNLSFPVIGTASLLFYEAELHKSALGVVMLEPIWTFWKTHSVVVGSLLQGANNRLFNTNSLVITNYVWKPGWRCASFVKLREVICLTAPYCFYYKYATDVLAATNFLLGRIIIITELIVNGCEELTNFTKEKIQILGLSIQVAYPMAAIFNQNVWCHNSSFWAYTFTILVWESPDANKKNSLMELSFHIFIVFSNLASVTKERLLLAEILCFLVENISEFKQVHFTKKDEVHEDSLLLFNKITTGKLVLVNATIVLVLHAGASITWLYMGKEIDDLVKNHSLDEALLVGHTLVDILVKYGQMNYAHAIFNVSSKRYVVTGTSRLYGLGTEAIFLFNGMRIKGGLPNDETLKCVLPAYAITMDLQEKWVDEFSWFCPELSALPDWCGLLLTLVCIAIAQLVLLTNVAALYGHQPPNIACYILLQSTCQAPQSLHRFHKSGTQHLGPSQLFYVTSVVACTTGLITTFTALHLEDKVNLKGEGNVMNPMDLIQQAQSRIPVQEDHQCEGTIAGYIDVRMKE